MHSIKRGLSRSEIKYFAMAAMLLNHIAHIFFKEGTLLFCVFEDIGYFTAVTMCYFVVEGYFYTHSKKRYAMRLAVFALISEVPFCLAFSGKERISFCGMNMIFTLLCCFGILVCLEQIKQPFVRGIAVTALTCLTVISDWPLLAALFTIFFYQNRGSKSGIRDCYCLAMLLSGALWFLDRMAYTPLLWNILYTLGNVCGIALSGICIQFHYDNTLPPHGSKWFFYVFYPAHLLVLGVLRLALL